MFFVCTSVADCGSFASPIISSGVELFDLVSSLSFLVTGMFKHVVANPGRLCDLNEGNYNRELHACITEWTLERIEIVKLKSKIISSSMLCSSVKHDELLYSTKICS